MNEDGSQQGEESDKEQQQSPQRLLTRASRARGTTRAAEHVERKSERSGGPATRSSTGNASTVLANSDKICNIDINSSTYPVIVASSESSSEVEVLPLQPQDNTGDFIEQDWNGTEQHDDDETVDYTTPECISDSHELSSADIITEAVVSKVINEKSLSVSSQEILHCKPGPGLISLDNIDTVQEVISKTDNNMADKEDKKKVLELMSLNFNSSADVEKAKELICETLAAKEKKATTRKSKKRRLELLLEMDRNDASTSKDNPKYSLLKTNPITQALKRVRKDPLQIPLTSSAPRSLISTATFLSLSSGYPKTTSAALRSLKSLTTSSATCFSSPMPSPLQSLTLANGSSVVSAVSLSLAVASTPALKRVRRGSRRSGSEKDSSEETASLSEASEAESNKIEEDGVTKKKAKNKANKSNTVGNHSSLVDGPGTSNSVSMEFDPESNNSLLEPPRSQNFKLGAGTRNSRGRGRGRGKAVVDMILQGKSSMPDTKPLSVSRLKARNRLSLPYITSAAHSVSRATSLTATSREASPSSDDLDLVVTPKAKMGKLKTDRLIKSAEVPRKTALVARKKQKEKVDKGTITSLVSSDTTSSKSAENKKGYFPDSVEVDDEHTKVTINKESDSPGVATSKAVVRAQINKKGTKETPKQNTPVKLIRQSIKQSKKLQTKINKSTLEKSTKTSISKVPAMKGRKRNSRLSAVSDELKQDTQEEPSTRRSRSLTPVNGGSISHSSSSKRKSSSRESSIDLPSVTSGQKVDVEEEAKEEIAVEATLEIEESVETKIVEDTILLDQPSDDLKNKTSEEEESDTIISLKSADVSDVASSTENSCSKKTIIVKKKKKHYKGLKYSFSSAAEKRRKTARGARRAAIENTTESRDAGTNGSEEDSRRRLSYETVDDSVTSIKLSLDESVTSIKLSLDESVGDESNINVISCVEDKDSLETLVAVSSSSAVKAVAEVVCSTVDEVDEKCTNDPSLGDGEAAVETTVTAQNVKESLLIDSELNPLKEDTSVPVRENVSGSEPKLDENHTQSVIKTSFNYIKDPSHPIKVVIDISEMKGSVDEASKEVKDVVDEILADVTLSLQGYSSIEPKPCNLSADSGAVLDSQTKVLARTEILGDSYSTTDPKPSNLITDSKLCNRSADILEKIDSQTNDLTRTEIKETFVSLDSSVVVCTISTSASAASATTENNSGAGLSDDADAPNITTCNSNDHILPLPGAASDSITGTKFVPVLRKEESLTNSQELVSANAHASPELSVCSKSIPPLSHGVDSAHTLSNGNLPSVPQNSELPISQPSVDFLRSLSLIRTEDAESVREKALKKSESRPKINILSLTAARNKKKKSVKLKRNNDLSKYENSTRKADSDLENPYTFVASPPKSLSTESPLRLRTSSGAALTESALQQRQRRKEWMPTDPATVRTPLEMRITRRKAFASDQRRFGDRVTSTGNVLSAGTHNVASGGNEKREIHSSANETEQRKGEEALSLADASMKGQIIADSELGNGKHDTDEHINQNTLSLKDNDTLTKDLLQAVDVEVPSAAESNMVISKQSAYLSIPPVVSISSDDTTQVITSDVSAEKPEQKSADTLPVTSQPSDIQQNNNVSVMSNMEHAITCNAADLTLPLTPPLTALVSDELQREHHHRENNELTAEAFSSVCPSAVPSPADVGTGSVILEGGVRKSRRIGKLHAPAPAPQPLAIAAPQPLHSGGGAEEKEELDLNEVADPSLYKVLCRCRERLNPQAALPGGPIYCQAVDSFEGRMLGCCNTVKKNTYLRVSGKIPFLLLCDIHRHRLRRHNCCPGCGLFCTQGVFLECRWSSVRHHYHKLCGVVAAAGAEGTIINEGVTSAMCPHCGAHGPHAEVHLDIKLARKPVVYLEQHQERKAAIGARMTWSSSTGLEVSPTSPTPPGGPELDLGEGRVVSAGRLAPTLDRDRLESAIVSVAAGKPPNIKCTAKSLYWACRHGDLEKVLQVLCGGVHPDARVKDTHNQTGLHMAASIGDVAVAHVLVMAGAALDLTDATLCTPLMLAIQRHHNAMVQYLVVAGAELQIKTNEGMTCLHLAAKLGNLAACRHLLDSGRLSRHAINTQDEGGWTPLVWASENRHMNVVKFLLERGANAQLCDVEQNTALHWAALSGCTRVCAMLLDRGCSIQSMNAYRDTPLHIAARQNHRDAVVLLLARGASIDCINSKQQTPLQCSVADSEVYLQLTLNQKLREVIDAKKHRTNCILSSDIAAGKEQVPIPCINGVDDEPLPHSYLYIAENTEAPNINIDRSITSLKWCQCSDGCNSSDCVCAQLNFRCWYDPEGRLLPNFNYIDPPMIFECNRACGCNKLSCNNRVVQHGITAHLQIFRTTSKGWGVRALKKILKGSYVCEYVGEIITDLEADQRQDDSYLFDLDNRDSETFCLDAHNYGNVARFINHLCSPNVTPVKVFLDHQDLAFPRIALYANRDIEAEEELGFDYGEKFWMIKYKQFTCTCGGDSCRYSASTIQGTLDRYNERIQSLGAAVHAAGVA